MNRKEILIKIYKQLEMITRIYTLNSKKYKLESTYWLTYSFKVATVISGQKLPKYITKDDILEHDKVQVWNKEDFEDEDDDDEEELDFRDNNFLKSGLKEDKDHDIEAALKRLEGFRIAIMIDNGQVQQAKVLLEQFLRDDEFSEQEQDSKMLMKSLLGILKSNFNKGDVQEREEGLKLMDEARKLSEEIKVIYERLKWLKITHQEMGFDVIGVKRQKGVIQQITSSIN